MHRALIFNDCRANEVFHFFKLVLNLSAAYRR